MNLAHDVRVDSQMIRSNPKTQHHEAVKHSKSKEPRDTHHILFPILGSEMAFISLFQYPLLAQIAGVQMEKSHEHAVLCPEGGALFRARSTKQLLGQATSGRGQESTRFCVPRAILILYILGHWTERSPCARRCQILVVVVLLLLIPAESTGVPCSLRTVGLRRISTRSKLLGPQDELCRSLLTSQCLPRVVAKNNHNHILESNETEFHMEIKFPNNLFLGGDARDPTKHDFLFLAISAKLSTNVRIYITRSRLGSICAGSIRIGRNSKNGGEKNLGAWRNLVQRIVTPRSHCIFLLCLMSPGHRFGSCTAAIRLGGQFQNLSIIKR